MTIGPRDLRQARLDAGLTQAEVAERLGTTQSAVARWERGAVTPSLAAAARFAEAVGATLSLTSDRALLEPDERARLQRHLLMTPAQRLAQLTNAVRFSLAGRAAMAEARRHA